MALCDLCFVKLYTLKPISLPCIKTCFHVTSLLTHCSLGALDASAWTEINSDITKEFTEMLLKSDWCLPKYFSPLVVMVSLGQSHICDRAVSTSERCYMFNNFHHWVRPWASIDRKQLLVCVNPLRATFLRENINIIYTLCHSSTLERHR